jgi:hypothetical protein
MAGPTPYGPTPAVLAIPRDARGIVKESLDLLTRSDSGLRGASFYIGFMTLVTVAPVVILLALVLASGGYQLLGALAMGGGPLPDVAWIGWLTFASAPAGFGYLAATVDARALATAVIGGLADGRPLRLAAAISLARARFWPVLGAQLLIGFITGLCTTIAAAVVVAIVGPVEPVSYGVQLVVGLFLGAPVVYVPAAVMLGETGVFESIRRSFTLARSQKRLALVVTLFGLISQFVVLFGMLTGIDAVARFLTGTGLSEDFPLALVVPITAALVFAMGTLVFLVEVIAAAPPVFAFIALTHYTRGLDAGRLDPVQIRFTWDPWVTPGLAFAAVIALLALLGGVLSLPI